MSTSDIEFRELGLMAASDNPAEVDHAHEQALIKMAQNPRLRAVAAMAYDRTRALAGREQKFGTQSVLSAGIPELWPVDSGTTDSERRKWGMPSLAELRSKANIAPLVTKANLRRLLRARRNKLSNEQIATFAQQLANHGEAALQAMGALRDREHTIVAAYWPLPGEADPRPLARLLAAQYGARLALPVVQGNDMTFREWRDDASLQPAGFGTQGPAPDAPELQPTIVLTPLLGFDLTGARLGQGKGYYDRKFATAPTRPLLVGIANSCQQLPKIPTDPTDLPLNLLLTEFVSTVPGQKTTNSPPLPH